MGRSTAWERDDRIEAERPPLDPGGVGESKETLPRILTESGLVSW
jgi:hypothetical protein